MPPSEPRTQCIVPHLELYSHKCISSCVNISVWLVQIITQCAPAALQPVGHIDWDQIKADSEYQCNPYILRPLIIIILLFIQPRKDNSGNHPTWTSVPIVQLLIAYYQSPQYKKQDTLSGNVLLQFLSLLRTYWYSLYNLTAKSIPEDTHWSQGLIYCHSICHSWRSYTLIRGRLTSYVAPHGHLWISLPLYNLGNRSYPVISKLSKLLLLLFWHFGKFCIHCIYTR